MLMIGGRAPSLFFVQTDRTFPLRVYNLILSTELHCYRCVLCMYLLHFPSLRTIGTAVQTDTCVINLSRFRRYCCILEDMYACMLLRMCVVCSYPGLNHNIDFLSESSLRLYMTPQRVVYHTDLHRRFHEQLRNLEPRGQNAVAPALGKAFELLGQHRLSSGVDTW